MSIFLLLLLLIIIIRVWLDYHCFYVYRYVSWCAFVSLSLLLSLFFSVFWYIIDNLHAHEQSRSAHSVGNCAIDLFIKKNKIKKNCVYTYVGWVSGYIITHCRFKCAFLDPCFSLSFSLNVFIRARLFWDWLYVYRYVCWSSFLSFSLSVSAYISVCLSQCPNILSIICMYVSKRVQLAQRVIELY